MADFFSKVGNDIVQWFGDCLTFMLHSPAVLALFASGFVGLIVFALLMDDN